MENLFLKALHFASLKHAKQRRKGTEDIPYINHLINVVDIMYFTGKEDDPELLAASVLHDIIEDTEVTGNLLKDLFGTRVAMLVEEVTDDMTLTYEERKKQQIYKAPLISADARKIKIADKISNIQDIITIPVNWSERKKLQYIEWSFEVVEKCKGVNLQLDKAFENIYLKAKENLSNI